MFDTARTLLHEAVIAGACPAASIEVGTANRPIWTESVGRLTFDARAPATTSDTIFDLASLTKVLATVPLVMQQVERGALGLDDAVAGLVPQWTGNARAAVTIRDLLAHCSGLPSYRPLYFRHRGESEVAAAICGLPLEYVPRSRSIYSDLDFILLGCILGGASVLPARVATLLAQTGVIDPLLFNPPASLHGRTAPSAFDAWRGRRLVGEPDDHNASIALGGIAGHAGLFGTAGAVGASARHLLQVLDGRTGAFRRSTLEEFITRRSDIPGSSRALGWDTMQPTSSCGTRMSPRAFGHTGFTGTSLWIDPDQGIYVVLLTNRVYASRSNGAIVDVRRRVHDAVMDDVLRSGALS
ncbi:MAG: serine hydrolase domain-containing protein [Vicinamibacterales bacterium]